MSQQTLVLIKPDAVERNHIGNIISKYENEGLKVVALKMVTASSEIATKHYEEHAEKPFFKDLLTYITRSPIVAMILEGDDAIEKVRTINGSTDPKEAAEGTIRNLYAVSKSENSVHASDSIESATREISIWF
ncbi:nucleoside-diphosphate kinase [Clostridium sp.]|uniref:nucleoside-diphosphate kinase n=1 Tax=Clostridium sp. TaxID=1506 RepID=UPI002FC64B77